MARLGCQWHVPLPAGLSDPHDLDMGPLRHAVCHRLVVSAVALEQLLAGRLDCDLGVGPSGGVLGEEPRVDAERALGGGGGEVVELRAP